MLCIIMPNVAVLGVVMLGVMAPFYVLDTAAESLWKSSLFTNVVYSVYSVLLQEWSSLFSLEFSS